MQVIGKLAPLLLPLALLGCHRAQQSQHVAGGTGLYAQHEWLLPASPGAAEPDLVATTDGRLLLSWINRVPGRRNAFQFDAWDSVAQRWQGAPRTIAVGDSLATNSADTPHIAATTDGALWVHWLQKAVVGDVTNVMLSRSADGGSNWSAPTQVNVQSNAEHGFAALWPATRSSMGIVWLDGHNMDTPPTASKSDVVANTNTTLRAALFDANLQRSSTSVIDTMTCDCCRTDVAITSRGALVAYRDRTAAEVRDIATARFDGAKWSAPRPVHADHWTMPACPVNGPAIAASGNNVVVAWYTAAGDSPTVKLARSTDAGDSFDAPAVLDRGAAVQGRVAVATDAQQVVALWVREDAGGQSLWLARYTPDLSRALQRIEIAKLQGRGRGTGFPQLALHDGDAYLVWTDVADGAPQLHGARLGMH
jgi:hypothetical protein